MPPIKVYKLEGSKNFKGNPKGNQTSYLWGWTARPTKFNLEEKWWKMMKSLRYNWTMPNDVGVICNGKKIYKKRPIEKQTMQKQTRMKRGQPKGSL
jgi:hypothetical protein